MQYPKRSEASLMIKLLFCQKYFFYKRNGRQIGTLGFPSGFSKRSDLAEGTGWTLAVMSGELWKLALEGWSWLG